MNLEEEQIKAEQQSETMTNELILLLLLAYSLSLKRSRSNIAQVYGQFGDKTPFELTKYNRLQKLTQSIMDDLNEAHKQNKKDIKKGLFDLYKKTYQDIATILGVNATDLSKQEINELIQSKINDLSLNDRLERLRRRSLLSIKQQLIKGIKAGDTFEKLSQRIKQSIDQDARKIRTIARTEAHRLTNQAKIDVANQSLDYRLLKVWDGTLDSRIRPAHRHLDGTTIPIYSNFISMNGGYGPAPGMMRNASDDVNCRCVLRFALAGV
jgi:SPP1 gp7 family putative phage head morphogenesis protein